MAATCAMTPALSSAAPAAVEAVAAERSARRAPSPSPRRRRAAARRGARRAARWGGRCVPRGARRPPAGRAASAPSPMAARRMSTTSKTPSSRTSSATASALARDVRRVERRPGDRRDAHESGEVGDRRRESRARPRSGAPPAVSGGPGRAEARRRGGAVMRVILRRTDHRGLPWQSNPSPAPTRPDTGDADGIRRHQGRQGARRRRPARSGGRPQAPARAQRPQGGGDGRRVRKVGRGARAGPRSAWPPARRSTCPMRDRGPQKSTCATTSTRASASARS